MSIIEAKAMYIVLQEFGLKIDRVDEELRTIYVSVPETSDKKSSNGEDVAGIYLARKFKTTINHTSNLNYTVRYRIRKQHWTHQMGDEAKKSAEETVL